MKPKDALTILTAHQEWRRGGDGPQADPAEIGLAIDAASALGKKGGLKRGPTKARTSEQARKAGLASAAARKAKEHRA